MRLWAKELLDYLHVPTWDASCQGPFDPCAWVNLPAECGTTPLDIFNTGGGGVQIRTQNCTWLFSDGCELYLPGGITFPDGSSIMSAPKALSITDGTHSVTGVTEINFDGAMVSGTSPNGIVTISSGGVTSVGMSVPSAFSVSPSTITSSGTFTITGAGNSSQYVNGAGALASISGLLSGTTNYIPYFSSTTSLVSGPLYVSGTNVALNTTNFLKVGAKDNATTAGGTTSVPSFTISNVSGVVAYSAQINDGSSDKRVAYFVNGVDSLWGHSFTQSSGSAYTYGIWMSTNRVLSLAGNGNMILRTSNISGDFTDTGYKLDVFGTLRVASAVTFSSIPSGSTSSLVYYNTATGAISYNATMPSGYTLGDTLYGNNASGLSALSGNTTTANKFLSQTGTGSVSAAPIWFDLFNTANTWSARQTFSASTPTLFTYTNASLGTSGVAITHLNSYASTAGNGNGAQWALTDSLSGKTISTVRLGYQSNSAGTIAGYVTFGIVNEQYSGSTVNPYFTIDGGRGMNASFVPLQILGGGNTATGIPSANPAAYLDVVGSFAAGISLTTSSMSLGDGHCTILCSAATGAINITLPQIAGRERRIYTIKKIDSSANVVTVYASSGEYVEGPNPSFPLPTTQFSSITVQAFNSNKTWYIIGKV